MNFKGRTATAIIEFPNSKILSVKRATCLSEAIGLCQEERLMLEKRLNKLWSGSERRNRKKRLKKLG